MRRSIRFRITAIAAATVAGVLIVAGLALVFLQRTALTASIDDALAQRAEDIGALLEASQTLPDEFAGSAREGFAQLVGPGGEVLVSTANLAGSAALTVGDALGTGDALRTVTGLEVDDDSFRVLSRRLEGFGILHVGTTYDVVAESTATLALLLALVIPSLVVAIAGLVWWLVGRTLQPVEDIRSEVAAIGSTDLGRRVPRPGSGDEIDRLAGTMNEMLDRLETSIDRQRRFVADASHELRSPLTRMQSGLDVGLAEAVDAGDRQTLKALVQDVVDMQSMVEDLLYLAGADEQRLQLVRKPLDFDELVIDEARRIRSHGRVDVDVSRVSGAHVVGDPSQLRRAVRNLLDNAERHAASQIRLLLREAAGMAVLTVTDDGPGIPQEHATRIFERFSRLDESRSAGTGGPGLGLAIARDIAERHHGTLSLTSPEAPGATFELQVPLAE